MSHTSWLWPLLAEAAPAADNAAAPAAGTPPPSGGIEHIFFLTAIMFVIVYFMMIRPQQRKEKERQSMLGGLKKNDHVITSGGIYGVVTQVQDDEVRLRIDDEKKVTVRVTRGAIATVVASGEKSGEKEPAAKAS